MENLLEEKKIMISDSNTMPWEEHKSVKTGRFTYQKMLVVDSDTGMEVRLNRYPAGVITPWHVHPCAHGMYVLQGTLQTQDGCFGPGSFVWFPEGSKAEHGATAEADLVVLFITNKAFAIQYVDLE